MKAMVVEEVTVKEKEVEKENEVSKEEKAAEEDKEEEKKDKEKEGKRIQKKLMPPPFKQFHHLLKLHQSPLHLVHQNLPRRGKLGPGSDLNFCWMINNF